MEETKTEETKISWDEAMAGSAFVKLETDEQKILLVTNPTLVKIKKFDRDVVEFQCDVLEEDGNPCEKKFTVSSRRLKSKLRPIFENKKNDDKVKLSVLRVGNRFDTQYSVKEI